MAKIFILGEDTARNVMLFNLLKVGEEILTSEDLTDAKRGEELALYKQALADNFDDFAEGRDLEDFTEQKLAEVSSDLGFNDPVIEVLEYEEHCCPPRAYERFPEIYVDAHPDKHEENCFFMRCPEGYDGNFFTPDNATLLNEDERNQMENSWFHGWGGIDPILHRYGDGVDLPEDFVPSETPFLLDQSINSKHCYVVEGKALQVLMRYLKQGAEFSTAEQNVGNKLRELAGINLEDGQYINTSYSEGSFQIGPCEKEGTPIEGIEFKHIETESVEGRHNKGKYRVLAGKCETPEGRELQALLDRVEKCQDPDLKSFEEGALSADGVDFIKHCSYGDRHYLLFYPKQSDGEPAELKVAEGLRQVPVQERNWLEQTKKDLDTRTPPPLPNDLVHLETTIEYMRAKTPRHDYIGNDGVVCAL